MPQRARCRSGSLDRPAAQRSRAAGRWSGTAYGRGRERRVAGPRVRLKVAVLRSKVPGPARSAGPGAAAAWWSTLRHRPAAPATARARVMVRGSVRSAEETGSGPAGVGPLPEASTRKQERPQEQPAAEDAKDAFSGSLLPFVLCARPRKIIRPVRTGGAGILGCLE